MKSSEALEQWCEENQAYHFEGENGVDLLTQLCEAIGYGDLTEFLADNPGAQERIVEFIGEHFDDQLQEHLDGEDDSDD